MPLKVKVICEKQKVAMYQCSCLVYAGIAEAGIGIATGGDEASLALGIVITASLRGDDLDREIMGGVEEDLGIGIIGAGGDTARMRMGTDTSLDVGASLRSSTEWQQ